MKTCECGHYENDHVNGDCRISRWNKLCECVEYSEYLEENTTKCNLRKIEGNLYCTCDCGLHKENGDYGNE